MHIDYKVYQLAYLLKKVLRSNGFQNILLRSLLNLAADNELVQHEVRLLKVEDDVQLTHLEIFIKY